MKIPKSDRTFLLAIEPYLNMDAVIAQLKQRKLNDCNFLSNADIRYAFLQWLKNHLESIENDASFFIRDNPKHFDKHLDLDKLQVVDYDDGFPEMSEQELRQMAIDMDPDYDSALEDDFDGTPEEVASSALSW